MPRTPLDTAKTDSQHAAQAGNGSWCERLWTRLKRSSAVLAASALVGLSANSADAQVMPAPVYSDSGAGAIWPSAGVQNAQPWPAISPYHQPNVLSTQHVNQNGLWLQQVYQKDRRFYFSAEAAHFNFGRPGKKAVGAPTLEGALTGNGTLTGANISNPGDVFIDDNDVADAFSGTALESLFDQMPSSFVLKGGGVFPYPLLSFDEADPTEASLDLVASNFVNPIRTLEDIGDVTGVGTRLRWGFDNGDGSGFELTGYVSGEGSSVFRRGLDISFAEFSAGGFNLAGPLMGSVPIDNGLSTFSVLDASFGITGATQKFDVLYQIEDAIRYGGAGFSIFNTPMIDKGAMRLRLTWGGEYVHVNDRFAFHGIDSGLAPDLTDFQLDAGVLPGGGNTGGGGGNNNNDILNSRYGAIDIDVVTPELTPNSPNGFYEAFLTSNTQSNLFGPTVGLRYDFGGGKKFMVWGETVVGLLANFEKTDINSHNIAEISVSKTVYGLDPLNDANGNARPYDFTYAEDEENHVTVSPMFRQAIHGELGLAALLPKLARNPFVDKGFLTGGYTVTVMGNVQRAGEAIYWRGFNGDPTTSFPYAISDRSTFVVQEVNLGCEWRY